MIHSKRKDHINHLITLLKALIRNGLKISPSRCQPQKIFEGLKKGISNPPVFVMSNNKGHVTLVSDTSGCACGADLYQEQKGRLRLVGYNSMKFPPAAIRYSIS